MYTRLTPVRHPAGEVPSIISGKYKTGEAIINGSLLAIDANGELILHLGGTNVDCAGVALEAAGSKLGYDAANSPTVVTGRVQEVSYAVADLNTVFAIRQEDGSGNLVAAAQTHIGEAYGVIKTAGGEWRIDRSEATTLVFMIVDVDIPNNVTFVQFLASALPIP
jgi:hypothetical protein